MELGVATFADLSFGVIAATADEGSDRGGRARRPARPRRVRDRRAPSSRLPDLLPAVALAAIAARTERIRLSSAVTVLSSDDPVRVFQQFAELDLISGGRAEIMAGRGSFIESFPLFGYDLDDYDELYAEKLDLLLTIRASERVTWSGRLRPPLHDAGVCPRPMQDPLPVWVAVGGSPESVVRAGTLGLPLTLAIIGGQPERFAPLVELYRQRPQRGRTRPARAAAGDQHARVRRRHVGAGRLRVRRPYLAMMNRIGRERGWPPSGRPEYEALRSPRGAVAAGSAEQVAEKILFEHELFGISRYVGQMSVGAVAHADVMRSMELFGTEVAPLVRAEVARREASAVSARETCAARADRSLTAARGTARASAARPSHETAPGRRERRLGEPARAAGSPTSLAARPSAPVSPAATSRPPPATRPR